MEKHFNKSRRMFILFSTCHSRCITSLLQTSFFMPQEGHRSSQRNIFIRVGGRADKYSDVSLLFYSRIHTGRHGKPQFQCHTMIFHVHIRLRSVFNKQLTTSISLIVVFLYDVSTDVCMRFGTFLPSHIIISNVTDQDQVLLILLKGTI